MPTFSTIEPLEGRIAPAILLNPTTLSYVDTDGDLVTVKFSKAFLTDVVTANTVFHFDTGTVLAAGSTDTTPQQLQLIDLTTIAAAEGTGITVTTKLAGNGDGFAAVGKIDATGRSLGAVAIKGDLGAIDASSAQGTVLGLKSLAVQSIGQYGTNTQAAGGTLVSTIYRGMGTLTVKSDIVGAELSLPGASEAVIKSITVGGSILATDADHTGEIIAAGSIGAIKIGGSLEGGDGTDTGAIVSTSGNIGAVTIGGSILGGNGNAGNATADSFTGTIIASGNIGAVKIGGNLEARSYDESGKIRAGGTIASIAIKGSIIGGDGNEMTGAAIPSAAHAGLGTNSVFLPLSNGQISATTGIGKVTIGGDLLGGVGAGGAEIFTDQNNLGSVKIGGKLLAGAGNNTASIVAFEGNVGAVSIGGDVQGAAGFDSGYISSGKDLLSILIKGSLIGGSSTFAGAVYAGETAKSIKVLGDVVGGSAANTGQLATGSEELENAFVGGSLIGGSGQNSGTITSTAQLCTVTVFGDVRGAGGPHSGSIQSANGFMDKVMIGGSLKGGSGADSGSVEGSGELPGLTIGGSLIAGTAANTGAVLVTKDIDSLTIKGSIIGTADHHATIAAAGVAQSQTAQPYVALKKIAVTGDVTFADIIAGNALGSTSGDAQIGSVKINGDFIASSIAAGVSPGPNGYGAGDTLLPQTPQGALATIASVTIGGQALGTFGGTDHFGIVAQQIKSVKVGGSVIPLNPLPDTDDRPLGITGDLTIHEV